MDILMSTRRQVTQCKFCHCKPESREFKKVLELEDVDIAIYRYLPADDQDESREIFLIQNSKGCMDIQSSIVLTKSLAKCQTDCPRCKAMLERAQRLLMTVPWVNRRGVAAVCDHLYQGECVFCPSCNAVADKFDSFITDETNFMQNSSPTTTKDMHIEDAMKSALDIQLQASDEVDEGKKTGVKSVRQTWKRTSSDSFETTAESKTKKGRGKIYEREERNERSDVNKSKTGIEQKEKAQVKGNQEYEQKAVKIGKRDQTPAKKDSKLQTVKEKKQIYMSVSKIGKQQLSKKTGVGKKMKSVTKLQTEQPAHKSLKSLQKLPSSGQQNKSRILDKQNIESSDKIIEEKPYKPTPQELAQMALMRILIAQQLKEIAKQDKMKKEHEKEMGVIEKKAAEAEKKIQDAERIAKEKEEARRIKLSSMARSFVVSTPSSVGLKGSLIEGCYDGHGADEDVSRMVKGEKICARKDVKPQPSPHPPHTPGPCPPPLPLRPPHTPTPASKPSSANSRFRSPMEDFGKGVLRYSLSDRRYIENGWTELPKEVLLRQMTMYQMSRAHPEFDWFELNKHRGRMQYSSGELLARFDEERCRLFYRSGKLALEYYEAEDNQAGQRLVIYSTGERDAHGRARSRTVLAMFDYAGNGVVYDHAGNVRLKYNQTEGIILDTDIGPKSHWKWHCLNDPPMLRTVIMDTQVTRKDPVILKLGHNDVSESIIKVNEPEMLAAEAQTIANNHAKLMNSESTYTPYKIRMKALKLNKQFSLKVLDQATIYLYFCEGTTNLKINVGMVLNPSVIVSHEFAEVGEVFNVMDKQSVTGSVEHLKEEVWNARTTERARALRERRLNPPTLSCNLDQWQAKLSRPLHRGIISGDNNMCLHIPPGPQYCSTVNY